MAPGPFQPAGGGDAGGGDASGGIPCFSKPLAPAHSLHSSAEVLGSAVGQLPKTTEAWEEKCQLRKTSGSLKSGLRVLGRIRPPLTGEEADVGCLEVVGQELRILDSGALFTEQVRPAPEPRTVLFDELLGQEAGEEELFAAVRGEVGAALAGETVCILAYGATGSGKTHSIMGLLDYVAHETDCQVATLLRSGFKMDVAVQIVEACNEQLRDLLVPGSSSELGGAAPGAPGVERPGGAGARLQEALRLAQVRRGTAAHGGQPSYPHLVITLLLRLHDLTTGGVRRVGKLSFVDLAGSHLSTTGAALDEGCASSTSLAAKVRRAAHVPSSNSAVTQLLQDALGAPEQCRAVVILALAPTWSHLEDTLHTLQFGSSLVTMTLLGRDSCTALSPLEQTQLRFELSKWQSECHRAHALLAECRDELEMKDRQLRAVEVQNAELLEAARAYRQSHMQLFHGLVAFDGCLQELEANLFQDTWTAPASASTYPASASEPGTRHRFRLSRSAGSAGSARAGATRSARRYVSRLQAKAVAGQPSPSAGHRVQGEAGAEGSSQRPPAPVCDTLDNLSPCAERPDWEDIQSWRC